MATVKYSLLLYLLNNVSLEISATICTDLIIYGYGYGVAMICKAQLTQYKAWTNLPQMLKRRYICIAPSLLKKPAVSLFASIDAPW